MFYDFLWSDPEPDPTKRVGSDRIRIHNTGYDCVPPCPRYFWGSGQQSPAEVYHLRTTARGHPLCSGSTYTFLIGQENLSKPLVGYRYRKD